MKTATLYLCILATAVSAQDFPRKEIDLTRIADEWYTSRELDANHEEIFENLAQLLAHPINLNRATGEDLRFLNILSEEQIKNLINHRTENKNLLSVYELQAVPGFDLETIYTLVPFVTVPDPYGLLDASLWTRIRHESDNYLLVRYDRRIESSKGEHADIAERFSGSPDKLSLRFRTSRAGDFSAGFTLEKDAGEKIRWNPDQRLYGFDYISCHVQLQNKGRLKNLVVGDYQCQFGQAVMLGGIFGTGKGSETITAVRRSNVGVLPYASSNESTFLRGVAGTVQVLPKFYLTGFFSGTHRDANVPEDSLTESSASSLLVTGLHRNARELSMRKKISNADWGSVFQYKSHRIEAGMMLHASRFGVPLIRDSTVYNGFVFRGTAHTNIGVYLNHTFQGFSLFGEYARSIGGGAALSGGILWSPGSSFDLAILYRNFARDFHSFYSNALSENSTTQNERGIYWGWKYRIARKVTLAGYVDLFQFPWLRYRSYAPTSGHEWLFRVTYQPARKVMLIVQGREESKSRNSPDVPSNLYRQRQGLKHNYLFTADYGLRQKLHLKTRAQFSTFAINGRTTKGFALMQDIQAETGRFQVTGRYALFNTEDYDNRQYAYENDVLLAYSMPAYDGTGVRKILMVEYKMNKHLSFWIRYAGTRYVNKEKIGSGLDTTEGNMRNDVKFQIRFRF